MKKEERIRLEKERVELDAEIAALQSNLKMLSVNDPLYAKTVEALDNLIRIRCSRNESTQKCAKESRTKFETGTKIISALGTLAIGAVGLALAYRIDCNDEIVRNRTSQGFFHKFFRF